MNDLKIEKWDLAKLKPYAGNAKEHPASQVEGIARSITEFGFNDPVAVDEDGVIIEGHGRLMAAEKLGLQQIPVIQLKHMTEEQKRAYIIAHNKLTMNSGFDLNILSKELEALSGLDFDLSLTGFNEDELSKLFKTVNEPEGDPDEIPEVPDNPVTVMGDLYEIGPHRLLCGDSTVVTDVERLMGEYKADLLHTDPPYNVDYSNAKRSKPSKKDLGVIKNDTMCNDDFFQLLLLSLLNAFLFLKDDSSVYVWYAAWEQINFTKAIVQSGFNFKQQIIWKKPMLLGRDRYQWAHEPCLFAVKGKPFFTDDRTKTTVWDFGGYDKSKNVHPTQKPVFIPEEAINNSSKEGSNVLDLFGGSGSTMVACHKTARTSFLMELDPKYCDVIIKRMARLFPDLKIKRNGKAFNLKQEAQGDE